MVDIWFANNMRNSMLFLVGAPNASNGANWTAAPPGSIATQQNRGQPYQAVANLPIGGSVAVSYRRTSVNQQPQIHVTITNNAGAVQVMANPTNAALLNGSVQQSQGQVIITFRGQEEG